MKTLSTSKAFSYAVLVAVCLLQAAPGIAREIGADGFPKAAHWVVIVAGILTAIRLSRQASTDDATQIAAAATQLDAVAKVTKAVKASVQAPSAETD
jgi:hypothetical protein